MLIRVPTRISCETSKACCNAIVCRAPFYKRRKTTSCIMHCIFTCLKDPPYYKYCVSLLMLVYSLEESEVMSGFQTPLRLGRARARDVLRHSVHFVLCGRCQATCECKTRLKKNRCSSKQCLCEVHVVLKPWCVVLKIFLNHVFWKHANTMFWQWLQLTNKNGTKIVPFLGPNKHSTYLPYYNHGPTNSYG